jgi:hypothetical protein
VGNQFDAQVTWDDGKENDTWVFKGLIDDDGLVHDGVEYLRTPGNMTSKWHSTTPMACGDGTPDAPAPAPAPNPKPLGKAMVNATVTSDVDVYDIPGGNGKVTGILRGGNTVQLSGSCKPEDWCEVSGDAAPGGKGWVWGHLQF